MNYENTLDYLFAQLPMYQRIGKAAYKADLSNTYLLCDLLNHPEKKFKSIHVAGTNGKGSTSHMIASVLQEAGYKVGLYTSPHLKDFRERIKINGEMIPENEVISFVEKHHNKFEQINLSFFEWTVGIAFDYFSKQQVDIAVVETGLGGRLDSTNVVHPEVSVITNIGMDHTQFLGESLEEIAQEKAGIIKFGIPIVIGETQKEIEAIFIEKARENRTEIHFADQEINLLYECDLKGNYQQKNVKTCLATIQLLKVEGWEITENNIRKGLLSIVDNTGLLGRWQVLNQLPLTVCDTGHNEPGVKEVVTQINKIDYDNLHMVVGFVNDKSVESILQLLPKNARYYFCEASIPRAMKVSELKELASKRGLKGEECNSVSNALINAQKNARPTDLIFIGGSTFIVAEVL